MYFSGVKHRNIVTTCPPFTMSKSYKVHITYRVLELQIRESYISHRRTEKQFKTNSLSVIEMDSRVPKF